MMTVDRILNVFIALLTLLLVLGFFRKDGKWEPERGKFALRFFTTQSNILVAAASLLTALALSSEGTIPRWIWTLKYIGTAAVTVTMLTVLLFLAPSFGKGALKVLLRRRKRIKREAKAAALEQPAELTENTEQTIQEEERKAANG